MRFTWFLALTSLASGSIASAQVSLQTQIESAPQAYGRSDPSEEILRKTLQSASASGNLDAGLVAALDNLADFLCTQRDYSEAEQLYLRGLSITKTIYGPRGPEVAILGNEGNSQPPSKETAKNL